MDITLTIFAQALAFAGLIWIVATKNLAAAAAGDRRASAKDR